MQLTLHVPDDLAADLRRHQARLPRILQLAVRELDAQDASGFSGLADVLDLLAGLPTPEQVIALRPSQALQERIDVLVQRSRDGDLSDEDDQHWRNYQFIEHLVRKAKIRAAQQLQRS
jgi:hypothetical protein